MKKPRRVKFEKINLDNLVYSTDDQVLNQLNMLESQLRNLSEKQDPTLLEIEICYLQREYDLRCKRRANHNKFIEQFKKEYEFFGEQIVAPFYQN